MKRILFSIAVILVLITSVSAQNTSATSMKSFVDALMAKMTVAEKIGQLNLLTAGEASTGSVVSTDVETKIKAGNVGGIFSMSTPARIRKAQEIAVTQSRLKIPIIFGMDVIHGYKTVFPIPLGVSCTWDMKAIEQSARIAATEATADGICWAYSPMVDVARDPRWGRISEGNGEDAFLGSQIAKAMVKGYQGDGLGKANTLMACVKHYALYGAAEAGRDYNTTDMSRIRMFNEYLSPYKAAIDAGVGSIMTSFNEIDGIPATANKWLLTDLLRKQWGFNGLVVTDYTSLNEMTDHGLGDLKTVSALALKAGVDMDMVGEGFLTTLQQSLKEGKITQQEIDNACRKVLEAKYKLGLFKDPYLYCNEQRASAEIFTDANRAIARDMAAKSFVLLKNVNNVLPLKSSGTIALVGPLADNKENMIGTWAVSGDPSKAISLLQGIKNVAPGVNVVYAKGANVSEDSVLEINTSLFGKPLNRDKRNAETMINEAVRAAQNADVIVAALGELAEMTGESSSRSDITVPKSQRDLLDALVKTGKPVIVVLFTGRPLAIPEIDKNANAILNTWFGGTEAGNAIADVLFGKKNPSGKLTTSFPVNVGQVPIYYNHKNTGRPLVGDKFGKFRSNYLDVSNQPLYPFGYGLSYSNFTYSDVTLSNKTLTSTGKITASVTVTNNSNVDGVETVQLYIRDLVGSVTRPVKELKGFKQIAIKAGDAKVINFDITASNLKFFNSNLDYVAEPGDFKVFIGGNSRDVKEADFSLSK